MKLGLGSGQESGSDGAEINKNRSKVATVGDDRIKELEIDKYDINYFNSLWRDIDLFTREWKEKYPELSQNMVTQLRLDVLKLYDDFGYRVMPHKLAMDKKFDHDVWRKINQGGDRLLYEVVSRYIEGREAFKQDEVYFGTNNRGASLEQIVEILSHYNQELALKNTRIIDELLRDIVVLDPRRNIGVLSELNREIGNKIELLRQQFVYTGLDKLTQAAKSYLDWGVSKDNNDKFALLRALWGIRGTLISPERFREVLGKKCLEKSTWWGKWSDRVFEPAHKLMSGKKH